MMETFGGWLSRTLRQNALALLTLGLLLHLLVFYYVGCAVAAGQDLSDTTMWHYGDLAEGFLHGHLSTLTEPDSVLKSAPDPYNPIYTADHLMWDYSYYHKKYYLYYGAPPALFLFVPYRLLTGQALNAPLALLTICAINLAVFALGLRALVRLEFPRFPLVLEAGLFVVYGMSNVMSYLVCQADMYQIAVASASTCLLLSTIALLLAVRLRRARLFWLGVAGGAWAMSAACRAPYLFAGFGFLLAIVYWWWPRWKQGERRQTLREACAWLFPAGVILLALGWYNWERFDSPFNFGQQLLVAGTDYNRIPDFSLSYLPDRLYEEVFMPFKVTNLFPYIDPSTRPQTWFYADRIADEHMTGILTSFPLLIVGLLWRFNVRRLPDPGQRRRLTAYGTWISLGAAALLAVLLTFCSVTFRYLMDVTTPLYFLTALSLMARQARGPLRRWEWALLALLAAVTFYAGLAYSLIGDPAWIWNWYSTVEHIDPVFF